MSDLYEFDWGGYQGSDYDAYQAPAWEMPAYEAPAYQGSDYDAYLPDYQAVAYQDPWGGFDYSIPRGSLVQPGAYDALSAEYGGYGSAGGAGSIAHYDPSTGVYFDTAGNPVQPQAASASVWGEQDPDAFARQGAYSQTAPNPYAPSAPYSGPAAAAAEATRPGSSSGGWLDTINNFMKSPLGGMLGAAGVGAAGLGIARGLAGPVPNAPQPMLAPGSPINAAGQNTMAQFYADQAGREAGYQAEQAPGYQGIRNQAMTLIPGQLNPVTIDQYQDPVRAALNAELMATMQGGASPLVEEQLRKDWATLQNTMYRQLGNNPDWQMSSPGQEAVNSFNRNAAIARDQSKTAKISAFAPLEQERARFGYQAPVEKARALGGEQRAYVDTLSRTSALGRMDPASLSAGLGGNPDQYRALMTNLGSQGQMAGYTAANQDRRDTMAGVGGIAGTVAGQVGSYGQADRIASALRKQYETPGGAVLGAPAW